MARKADEVADQNTELRAVSVNYLIGDDASRLAWLNGLYVSDHFVDNGENAHINA